MPKEIKYRKLDEITELPGNPRYIKDDQFQTLCDSLQDNPEYFEARPIILSNRTGKLIILAGNQRYRAAKSIGRASVPTILLEGLTEAKEKEIIIRDNISNGNWDWDILANEWNEEDLKDWGLENMDFPVEPITEEEQPPIDSAVNRVTIDFDSANEALELYNELLDRGLNVKIKD